MKTIYFVRHGETVDNVADIVSGAGNDSPLTKKGREQAQKTGKDLAGKSIELIVSSPLSRTIETATIIAKEIGYDPGKIVVEPLFIEIACGIYENGPEAVYIEDRANSRLHSSVESTEQMYQRMERALESLKKYPATRILVVSHGGVSRALRAVSQKIHHSKTYEIERIDNAEIIEFEL